MKLNVITGAKEAFEDSMENPNGLAGLITVLVSGLLLGSAIYILLGNPVAFSAGIAVHAIQWIVLSGVLWGMHFMFKKKKAGNLSLTQILSATGRLWILVAMVDALLLLGSSILGLLAGLLGIAMFLMLIIGGVLILYSYYKLVEVIMDSNKERTVIVWLLSLILTGLITTLIFSLINLVL